MSKKPATKKTTKPPEKAKRPVGRPLNPHSKAGQRRAAAAKAVDPKRLETAAVNKILPAARPTTKLEYHPLANLLPMMSPSERSALRDDVKRAARVKVPLVLLDGKILDGRNRYEIATELGLPFETRDFDPKVDGTPIDFVYSSAIHRNLSDTQKACAAVEFLPHFEDEARRRMSEGGKQRGGTGSAPLAKLVDGKTREEWRAWFADLSIEEQRDLYEEHFDVYAGSITAGELAVQAEKILDHLFKTEAREQAGGLFGVSGRYVSMAKSLKETAADLFAECFNGGLVLTQARNQVKLREREKNVVDAPPAVHVLPPKSVIEADAIEYMDGEPADSIDCAFGDSPYNNGWGYDADPHRDSMTPEKFIDWSGAWIRSAARVLSPTGSIFVLIDDEYSDPIGMALRAAGLFKQPTIVWWETFGMHDRHRLTPCARFIHHYTKQKEGFVKNDLFVPSARLEVYKDKRANPLGTNPTTVWRIARKQGTATDAVPFEDAPPQLPVEIPERCILMATDPGARVHDPFCGNGTTIIAALRNGRRATATERSPKYARQARQWIQSQLAQPTAAKAAS